MRCLLFWTCIRQEEAGVALYGTINSKEMNNDVEASARKKK
jgi:hypothetical protein